MYKKILEDIKNFDEGINIINAEYKKGIEKANQYAEPLKSKFLSEANEYKRHATYKLRESVNANMESHVQTFNDTINGIVTEAPSQDLLNSLLMLKARNGIKQEELNAYASKCKNYSSFNLINEIAEKNGLNKYYKEIPNLATLQDQASSIQKLVNDFYTSRANDNGLSYQNALLLNGSMLEAYEKDYNAFINAYSNNADTTE